MGRARQQLRSSAGVSRRDGFATVLGEGRGLSGAQRAERTRVLAARVIPKSLERLAGMGFLEATTLPSGESGYTITARGLRYYGIAEEGDAVAALLARMMLTALSS